MDKKERSNNEEKDGRSKIKKNSKHEKNRKGEGITDEEKSGSKKKQLVSYSCEIT